MKERTKTYLLLAIFVVLSSLILFPHLGSHAFFTWDEARLAGNAFEMYNNGDPIVTYFDSRPDNWNTKPPLLIWLQAICIWLFSPSEWAVRLPSSVAFIVMGIGIILGFKRLGYLSTGFFAVIVCLCSEGLFRFHCFRSADYDATLICGMMMYLISFLLYTQTKKGKYILLFFIFLTLDTLTKGIQALIPMPALLIWSIVTHNLKNILTNKYTYIGAAIFCLFVFGYYFLRENADPGYLKNMIFNEITGRYGTALENHDEDTWFYVYRIKEYDFSPFIFLLPFCILFNYLYQRKGEKSKFTSFFLLNALFYFCVITIGRTKIEWYQLPIIPMLAVTVGISMDNLLQITFGTGKKWITALYITLIVVGLAFPYYNIIDHNFHIRKEFNDDWFYCRNYIMKDIAKGTLPYDDVCYINDKSDNDQSSVYYWHLMDYYGKRFHRIAPSDVSIGMTIQVNTGDNYENIRRQFIVEELYKQDWSRIIKIKDKKQ